jgi:hypothetical protein
MPADASIFGLVQQPKARNPLEDMAQVMQIQHAMGANAVNDYNLRKAAREDSDANALSDLYKGAVKPDGTVDRTAVISGAAQRGLGAKIPTLQKGWADTDKAQSDVEKQKLEIAKQRTELTGQAAGWLRQNPTPQNAVAFFNHLSQNGIMPADAAAKAIAMVQADPNSVSQVADLAYRTALSTKDQLAKYETRNTGGTTDTLRIDPVSNKVEVASSVQNTQSPDNKATVGASMANAAATRELAQSNRDAANIQTGFQNEQKLRQEFEGLPEVKNYKQAFPAYAAIKDAAGRNTTQSDINIVYGLAKLYDPNSVVREGEYATVANSPNIPEKVKGWAQYLAGGGKLSADTKAKILEEAKGRIGTYETEARKARGSYEGIARKRGMDPSSVFADMGNLTQGGGGGPVDIGSLPLAGSAKVVNFGDLK